MKKRKVFFIVIFVACMIAMPVLTVLGPYTNVSSYEQRGLAPIPQLTKADVWDGSFFSDIETALTDHIAFRDGMVKNHTRLSMALERPVVSDLIVSSDVLLDYFGFYYWDIGYIDGQAAAAAEAYRELNDYITSYGGYFCFLGVPQQAIYFADHYPTTPRPKSSVSRRNRTIRRSNLISKRHLARLLMLISERSMP